MNKLIVFGFLLSVVVLETLAFNENSWYGNMEPTCLSQGGLCIVQSECAGPIGRPGELCPQQASQGYQCCKGLPVHERRCSMRGGECFKMNSCNQRFVYSEASDCGKDQECCILI